MRAASVEGVVGHGERAFVDDELAQAGEVVLAVVPLDEHREHRFAVRDTALEPVGEELHDLLRDGRQRVDPAGPVLAARHVLQGGQLVAHARRGRWRGRRRPSGWSNHRNRTLRARSPTTGKRSWVATTSRSSTSRAAASSGGSGHGSTIQRCSSEVASATSGAERCWDEEDPEHGLLELGGAVEAVEAVVAQHVGELAAELLRQRAPVGVEALEVGVEVLARAVHAVLDVRLLAGRAGCG